MSVSFVGKGPSEKIVNSIEGFTVQLNELSGFLVFLLTFGTHKRERERGKKTCRKKEGHPGLLGVRLSNLSRGGFHSNKHPLSPTHSFSLSS